MFICSMFNDYDHNQPTQISRHELVFDRRPLRQDEVNSIAKLINAARLMLMQTLPQAESIRFDWRRKTVTKVIQQLEKSSATMTELS